MLSPALRVCNTNPGNAANTSTKRKRVNRNSRDALAGDSLW